MADEMRNIKCEAEFPAGWQPLLSCPFTDGSCLAQGLGAQSRGTLRSTLSPPTLCPSLEIPTQLCFLKSVA